MSTAMVSPPRRGSASRDRLRTALRGLGQALISLGVLLLLFVAYELWVSNLFAAHEQAAVRHQLEKVWARGQDPIGRLALPGSARPVLSVGTGIANLYVPRFGSDYVFTVVEGTDAAALDQGPGHYQGTALPGQVGNFALAGHRVGKGEPFLNLDQLRPGDPLVVETGTDWYVYRVLGDPVSGNLAVAGADGVPGREIVSPADIAVIAPVPDAAARQPSERLMTLTTCHPKYTANQRMAIHAKLARAVTRQGDRLPSELSGGTL